VDIVVLGSVAYDDIETPRARRKNLLGGSGIYFSLAASFGARVGLVACVGTDFLSKDKSILSRRGIRMNGLDMVPGKTFRWSGRYGRNPNERETLKLAPNVFSSFRPEIPPSYLQARFVFLGNIDPSLQKKVLDFFPRARVIGCDTMNHWIDTRRKDLTKTLRRVHLLVLNDEEARMLSGEESLAKAGAALLHLGPKAVVIKRGEYGAVIFHAKGIRILPALLLGDVVDPTGAGDAFAGGLFAQLIREGRPLSLDALARAALRGTVMASLCVEKFGVQGLAALTPKSIQRRQRRIQKVFCS